MAVFLHMLHSVTFEYNTSEVTLFFRADMEAGVTGMSQSHDMMFK